MNRRAHTFFAQNIEQLKQKLLWWANSFDIAGLLNSNISEQASDDKYSRYDMLVGAGMLHEIATYQHSQGNSFDRLLHFSSSHNDWLFGFFSYDLKNEIEPLYSRHPDFIRMPLMHFFVPQYVVTIKKNEVTLWLLPNVNADHIWQEINETIVQETTYVEISPISARFDKVRYTETLEKIKHHIQRGDIYEVNFCQEFYSSPTRLHPAHIYSRLRAVSPTPFSCFYRLHYKYLMCASPERFMQKTGSTIISQPIKGTIRRGGNEQEDLQLKQKLQTDQKEIAENIMIVDLVRNDLSKIAARDTVKVPELLQIYTFPQVHHLISTVQATLRNDISFTEAIRQAFPMGSMTGAPKISAMQIIEQYELTQRGLYSGTVGYITPNQDFDFNVVIRSMLYNAAERYLSFSVGGAVTAQSDSEQEYSECMLKAKAMMEVLARRENTA